MDDKTLQKIIKAIEKMAEANHDFFALWKQHLFSHGKHASLWRCCCSYNTNQLFLLGSKLLLLVLSIRLFLNHWQFGWEYTQLHIGGISILCLFILSFI